MLLRKRLATRCPCSTTQVQEKPTRRHSQHDRGRGNRSRVELTEKPRARSSSTIAGVIYANWPGVKATITQCAEPGLGHRWRRLQECGKYWIVKNVPANRIRELRLVDEDKVVYAQVVVLVCSVVPGVVVSLLTGPTLRPTSEDEVPPVPCSKYEETPT